MNPRKSSFHELLVVVMAVPPVAAQESKEKTDNKENQEYPEKDKREAGDGRGNPSKTEHGGNQREDQ